MAIIRNPNKKNSIQNSVVEDSIEQFKTFKEQESQTTQFQPQFTKDEAIWMMGLIKNCTFKGEDIQKVYEAVVKLQLIVNESN